MIMAFPQVMEVDYVRVNQNNTDLTEHIK